MFRSPQSRRWLVTLVAALAVVQVSLAFVGAPWAVAARLCAFTLCLGLILLVYLRLREQETRYQVLLEISQELTSQTELGDLLDHIVRAIAALVPAAEKCVIHFLDPTGRRLYPRYVSHAGSGRMVGMPADSGIAGRALQRLETILVNDVRREPGFLPLQSEADLRALLVAPLYIGRERLGTLSLNSASPGAFGPQDRILVTLLAAQASIALYQQRLQTLANQARQHSELVLDSLPDALLVLDDEQRLLRHSPALATVLGPDLAGLVGQRVQIQSSDSRLQRLAYLIGDCDAETPTRRRVTIEEPVHAALEVDVTPVADEAGRWLRVVVMHDVTHLTDALQEQTRLVRAIAHGLQAPLASLAAAASPETAAAARRLERLRQDLVALSEPMEALRLEAEALVPLRAVLDRLPADLPPDLAEGLRVHVSPALALQRVRGRWLGHLLAHMLEKAWAQSGAAELALVVSGDAEELVLSVRSAHGAVPRQLPQEEMDRLGFGTSQEALTLLVMRRLAEALGGHLWMQPEVGGLCSQLILPRA